MEIEKVAKNVWKIYQKERPFTKLSLSSNIYVIKGKEVVVVDLGNKFCAKEIIEALSNINIKREDVKKIIYTHLHFDHTGNPALFPNAKIYASKEELNDLKKPALFTFFPPSLKDKGLIPLERIKDFRIIKTPGHTAGSICLLLEKEKILFSGDTLFRDKIIGRTDLLTSQPEKMESSLRKLNNLNYKLLCPGHGKNDKKRLLF